MHPVSFEQEDLQKTHDLLLPGVAAEAVNQIRKGMMLVVAVFVAIFAHIVLG